jgi:hypothetical protein
MEPYALLPSPAGRRRPQLHRAQLHASAGFLVEERLRAVRRVAVERGPIEDAGLDDRELWPAP